MAHYKTNIKTKTQVDNTKKMRAALAKRINPELSDETKALLLFRRVCLVS